MWKARWEEYNSLAGSMSKYDMNDKIILNISTIQMFQIISLSIGCFNFAFQITSKEKTPETHRDTHKLPLNRIDYAFSLEDATNIIH